MLSLEECFFSFLSPFARVIILIDIQLTVLPGLPTFIFADLISIVRTPVEFLAALEDQIKKNEKATVLHDVKARQKAVANYSWDARFQQVEDVVGNSILS